MSTFGKALITGAAGFIGSRLCALAVKKGYQVRAFIRYSGRVELGLLRYYERDLLNEIEIFRGDLKDPEAVRQAVSDCRLVFHLGALIAIPYSYVNPTDFVQTNVLGTLHVLNACRQANVERLIHTSTSEVYGTARYTPIDEAHPLQGQSPYSASKIGADKLVESYCDSFNLPAVTIRPFNTFGPGQSARAVIPTITSQALSGQDIHIGNLAPRRDFTFVDDTVNGFLLAAQAPGALGETINLGFGKDISIGELAQEIIDLINPKLKLVTETNRLRPEKSEVMHLLSDNQKAKRLLGWQPEISFNEGMGKTIEWIKAHPDWFATGSYQV